MINSREAHRRQITYMKKNRLLASWLHWFICVHHNMEHIRQHPRPSPNALRFVVPNHPHTYALSIYPHAYTYSTTTQTKKRFWMGGHYGGGMTFTKTALNRNPPLQIRSTRKMERGRRGRKKNTRAEESTHRCLMWWWVPPWRAGDCCDPRWRRW
jgi:hypothetical protein